MTIANREELIFDNKRIKMLKYIKRLKSVTYLKFKRKFKNEEADLLLNFLNNDIVDCINTIHITDSHHISHVEYNDNSIFKLSTKGNYVLENYITFNRKWKIPIVISVIALLKACDKELISLFNLICNILFNN